MVKPVEHFRVCRFQDLRLNALFSLCNVESHNKLLLIICWNIRFIYLLLNKLPSAMSSSGLARLCYDPGRYRKSLGVLAVDSARSADAMGYKKERLGKKILRASRSGERYRDIHVFIGGTGAVGGTALLHMVSMYEEMMSIRAPETDDVPILVATGRGPGDIQAFTQRLFRFVESRHGTAKRPKRVASGYLTHSGIFVALQRFQLTALPGLSDIQKRPIDERPAFLR